MTNFLSHKSHLGDHKRACWLLVFLLHAYGARILVAGVTHVSSELRWRLSPLVTRPFYVLLVFGALAWCLHLDVVHGNALILVSSPIHVDIVISLIRQRHRIVQVILIDNASSPWISDS